MENRGTVLMFLTDQSELSAPSQVDAAHDANQVLEALVEGFRLVLAGA